MSLFHSPSVVTNGLIFYYDMNNSKKSFVGAPTTNYAWLQNPRIDSSYASYSATASGTWNAKHPDAIRVYNQNGTEITGYVNTGVGDWTNTYHAIWTYDRELERPVVTMRDFDGQWKAKSFGLSVSTPAAMGLGLGSSYTISWLSWTDDITKCANAGMYSRRASDGVYNFYDGQSNSQSTAFNTKVRTWQRVYATYTVNSVIDINSSWSCYMYGHYGPRGTVKIADVQIEPLGYATGFNDGLSRSNTQAILPLIGNNTITANSLTYNSDNTFSFNGSSNYLTAAASADWAFGPNGTVEQWVYITGNSGTNNRFYCTTNTSAGLDAYLNGGTYNVYFHGGTVGTTSTIPTNQWVHFVTTYNSGTMTVYFNGVLQPLTGTTTGYNITTNSALFIGEYSGGGNYYLNGRIANVKVYKKGLSAAEVQQNFNALRGRYGI